MGIDRMKYKIKRIGKDVYFARNICKNINHWVCREEAKIYSTVFMAKDDIRKYKLKNIEIEKIQNERKIFKRIE